MNGLQMPTWRQFQKIHRDRSFSRPCQNSENLVFAAAMILETFSLLSKERLRHVGSEWIAHACRTMVVAENDAALSTRTTAQPGLFGDCETSKSSNVSTLWQ